MALLWSKNSYSFYYDWKFVCKYDKGIEHSPKTVELRQVFANVMEKLMTSPLMKTENLRSFARVFVTEQPGRRIVHILSIGFMRENFDRETGEPLYVDNFASWKILADLMPDYLPGGKPPPFVFLTGKTLSYRYREKEFIRLYTL